MRLVPLSPQMWPTFCSWFPTAIPSPENGIFISIEKDGKEVLAGGVCIFETRGPYVLFEHFALNPKLSSKMRHAVAQAIFQAAKPYLVLRSKIGFCHVSFQGGANMLQNIGFQPQDTQLLTFIPEVIQAEKAEPDPEEEPVALSMESAEPDPEEDERFALEEDDDDFIEVPKRRKKANKAKKRAKKKVRRRSLA